MSRVRPCQPVGIVFVPLLLVSIGVAGADCPDARQMLDGMTLPQPAGKTPCQAFLYRAH